MATDSDTNIYEKLTLGIIKSFEKKPGVCNICQTDKAPADRPSIISWEQKYSCLMPDDARGFYMTSNGITWKWSCKMNDVRIPVGHMHINALDKLVRIAASGSSDQNSTIATAADLDMDSDEETEIVKPKFDHRSRIFELDPCDGYGKVCYVYRNTKPGIPAQQAEVWFLDRALQWHFLASNFLNYYRLMLGHLGLPQWQYIFTDSGLSPQAKQWFNLYCPMRLYPEGEVFDNKLEGEKPALQTQLDIGRVFKGKSDKKKSMTSQAIKRKPMPSAKSQNPLGNKALGSSIVTSKPTR